MAAGRKKIKYFLQRYFEFSHYISFDYITFLKEKTNKKLGHISVVGPGVTLNTVCS